MTEKFDYDIAFSFHGKDEGLATALNDRLQERFKTFLYSEQQKKLGGTDGEKTFNEVFGERARIVVVLYRSEWGQTPFTRIEETAIRNRAHGEGYDFTVFIPTEDPPSVPKWLPKQRLYVGLKRWGVDGAAAVIESRAAELGSEAKPESIADRAARFGRAAKLKEAQKRFLNSDDGVKAADAAFDVFRDKLFELTNSLSDSVLMGAEWKRFDRIFALARFWPVLTVSWIRHFINTLDDAALHIGFHDGFPRIPGAMVFEPAPLLKRYTLTYELLDTNTPAYVMQDATKRTFEPEALAEFILQSLFDEAQKRPPKH